MAKDHKHKSAKVNLLDIPEHADLGAALEDAAISAGKAIDGIVNDVAVLRHTAIEA